jgi:hypothetical protein
MYKLQLQKNLIFGPGCQYSKTFFPSSLTKRPNDLECLSLGSLSSMLLPYFIEYSAHFYRLKMMLKYSLGTIHGR